MDRRRFLHASTLLGGASLLTLPAGRAHAQAPAVITRDAMRPQMPHGIQSGDPIADGAIVWTRGDRPSRLWLEWSTTASFANLQRVRGPHLLEDSDFTGRVDLRGLPAGQEIFYRVVLQDLHNERVLSEPVAGHLRLPAASGAKDGELDTSTTTEAPARASANPSPVRVLMPSRGDAGTAS